MSLSRKKKSSRIEDEDTPSTEITPEMQKASSQGWGMLKHNIIFPALPAVLQDVWVLLEVLILFTAFFLGVVEFSRMETFTGFDVFFFVLSLVDVDFGLFVIGGFITGFITEAGYETKNDPEKARDFGLFVIGGFYLILAVYIMRIFMIAGSMVSLIRIPVDKKSTHGNSD